MTMTSSGNTAAHTAPPANVAQPQPSPSQSIPPSVASIDPRDPWQGVEAKPLTAPSFDQIKKKNLNIEIRWANRAVLGSNTPFLRYEQLCSQGWVPIAAKELPDGTYECADVYPPPGSVKDGRIQIYDVILMKIDKRAFLANQRYQWERVNNAVRRPGVVANANESLRSDLAKEGVANRAKGKISTFIP